MGGTQIEVTCIKYWSILYVEMCEAFDYGGVSENKSDKCQPRLTVVQDRL